MVVCDDDWLGWVWGVGVELMMSCVDVRVYMLACRARFARCLRLIRGCIDTFGQPQLKAREAANFKAAGWKVRNMYRSACIYGDRWIPVPASIRRRPPEQPATTTTKPTLTPRPFLHTLHQQFPNR